MVIHEGRVDASIRPRIVVMGVSACGKSTVSAALATRLGLPFVDADKLHPAANVEKMASGIPLDDDDRRPWLAAVRDVLAGKDRPVVACSALRRVYRDMLRQAGDSVVFVHLTGSFELLAARAGDRVGHFMPPQLLRSQFDALEPLGSEEHGVSIDVGRSIDDIVKTAQEWLLAHQRA
ncbi:gluconokinase [Microbacterium sp. YJN-G]|uniref:gluconokinase n=1 Tax=Microbacterium sp. YJN-G TaxID=2763257 RepID=UPI0018785128|nr:gluconokinase [Microbacterium sp. YJN-G]